MQLTRLHILAHVHLTQTQTVPRNLNFHLELYRILEAWDLGFSWFLIGRDSVSQAVKWDVNY